MNMDRRRGYVKMFEDFSNKPSYADVLGMLKAGDDSGARKMLHEIVDLDPEDRMRYDSYRSPSEDLERKAGITGISKKWKMPFGFNDEDLQFLYHMSFTYFSDVHREERSRMHGMIFDAMVDLNPGLKGAPSLVKRGRPGTMGDVIMGCISRFNLDDMEFFALDVPHLKNEPNGSQVVFTKGTIDQEYTDLRREVKRRLGENINWFASPKTMRSILKKLDEKGWDPKFNVRVLLGSVVDKFVD